MILWARIPSWGPATSSPLPAAAFASAPPALFAPPWPGTWLEAAPLSFMGLWAQAPKLITVTSNTRLSIFRIVLSINYANLYHIGVSARKRRPDRIAHIGRVGAQALRGQTIHGHALQYAVAALDPRINDHGPVGRKTRR